MGRMGQTAGRGPKPEAGYFIDRSNSVAKQPALPFATGRPFGGSSLPTVHPSGIHMIGRTQCGCQAQSVEDFYALRR